MRRIIVFVSLVISMVTMQAQVISWQNTYRQNDRLTGKQIVFPNLCTTGTGLVWDISQRQDVGDDGYIVEYISWDGESDGLTAAIEQDSRYIYNMKGDSLLVTGFENRTSLLGYDMQEAWLKFPMAYGDSIEGHFHGTGKYCDRLGVRHIGRYKTKAVGTGILVVTEGDTLRNVVCLHTERTMSAELMPIELLDSLPAYTTDSIDWHLACDTALIRTDICRWYASGYRYPIVETRRRIDSGGEHVLSAQAYYFPPSEQAMLGNDPENEQTRASAWEDPFRQGGADPQLPPGKPWGWPAVRPCLEPSADGEDILFSYSIPQESLISYRLYSLDGYLLKELTPQVLEAGAYTDRISLQGHIYGVYVLDLQMGSDRLNEKLTLKK